MTRKYFKKSKLCFASEQGIIAGVLLEDWLPSDAMVSYPLPEPYHMSPEELQLTVPFVTQYRGSEELFSYSLWRKCGWLLSESAASSV